LAFAIIAAISVSVFLIPEAYRKKNDERTIKTMLLVPRNSGAAGVAGRG
jgi:hypothetical protein